MGRRIVRRTGLDGFPRIYLSALRRCLGSASVAIEGPAERVGARARDLGLGTLELARVHDSALAELGPGDGGPRGRRVLALRAATFFSGAIAPIERILPPAVEARARYRRLGDSRHRGVVERAALLRVLGHETARRKTLEAALHGAEKRHRALLDRSRVMEEQLRSLTRRLIASHEEERRRISRELHDALGQTLTGINVGLATLRSETAADSRGLRGSIARTQRLVRRSMRTVHRFARDLRPTLLDDLGLVPALRSLAADFGRLHGIRIRFSAPGDHAGLDPDRSTALFRVAQEALVNVGRHARARHVRVTLRCVPGAVRMQVWNDGRAFDVERVCRSRTNRHLGILCMQERVEMVGGTFRVESSPEAGTTVRAEVPLAAGSRA